MTNDMHDHDHFVAQSTEGVVCGGEGFFIHASSVLFHAQINNA